MLASDRDAIHRFNLSARSEHLIHLEHLPEPYLGQPDAPVVLLNLNPGHNVDDDDWHTRESFVTRSRRNLLHGELEYPFYLLDPREPAPGHHWWRRRLSRLIAATSLTAVARRVLCVEYFPYHSSRFAHRGLVVPSQRYSFELVEQAIERNAIVVLMRSSSLWLPAVPALATYRRLLRVRSVQNPTISESNLSEGFRELVDAIRDTPRARGRIEVVVDSVRSAAPRSESARAIGEFNRKGVKGMSNEMDAAGRDITRFRVRLGSQIRDELPKRRVMLEIARYLVAVGIPPDAVAAKMVGRRANQRWFKVPSKHDGPSFVRAALALERSFDPHRWFVDSDELVTFGGDTFALSNQWGSKTFPPTIDSFERAFSFHGLEVTPRP